MSKSPSPPEDGSHSARSKMKGFLKEGLSRGKDELLKGKLKLEHSLGLGHKPNVIPPDEVDINAEHRAVEIGWHPVAGLAGKWFAEKTGLGRMVTEKIHKYPDPTQHWAVLVGDYCHELWMDEHLDVIYINEKVVREEWHTFEVGKTKFNDEALRQAGEMVIYNMRTKQPGYNIISNNCQNFATLMLDAIQVGAHREFATSFAVYQRAIGAGSITDLFADKVEEEEEVERPPEGFRLSVVQFAQKVMDQHTSKLDNHHSLF
ncbi:hypothetical protein QBC33DRAFT_552243 [Phialemonium atrogriseum]|uniref:PPPDE domain-containing protein n=1 Tax=Phialemonium atrogriseum TaxID=1093897 RepID=A0AAJ0BQQ7_9PEZI|nr:uncharacterized protein QBC33DRAFT_552243 [Phialemonium atrogriseum]KAK1762302.1 hypothetical protein QBC33DRAFT_552243 [Phialemonium atrogriseum]